MWIVRRTAARAITATPSRAFLAKPRTFTSVTSIARTRQQNKWPVSLFQKRFFTDEAKEKSETSVEGDSFAQTAAEAPVDEDVTPIEEAAAEATPEAPQAEPTDAEESVGIDALQAAADGKTEPATEKRPGASNPPNKTVYVGNLYYEVAEDQLKRVFGRFGPIESVKVIYDNRGLSRGFGYVEFGDLESAQSAVENLDMQVFEGRNLVVQFHRARTSTRKGDGPDGQNNPPAKTLFIGNMSFEMSDKDLNDLFRDIRNVIDVRVAIDRRTGQPRGFAHADFIDIASAMRAREVLAAKVIYGRQLRVDYSTSGTQSQRGGREGREKRRENSI
ncbi:RNA binding domain-containing protein [Lophiotrema nucula]|uniref:RNA binding domain-containing protein n=1 Tax=Lophiotrema nucula TaxID=690887 RepID=A0A6A5YR22_9PLEO|nr:RNA binding domain-containing protein [Lophiotrema nucula]